MNWGRDIRIKLTELLDADDGRVEDGRAVERTVFSRFGPPESRFVQEICTAVGGFCVYFRMSSPEGREAGDADIVVPVANWLIPSRVDGPGLGDRLSRLARDIVELLEHGWLVTATGTDRTRYRVEAEELPPADDALDSETSETRVYLEARPVPETSGSATMRETF